MATYTAIPEDTFNEVQYNAGVVLTEFDPSSPALNKENIVCATTGGITISCVPTYSDLGEDVDNCPNNMKELKILQSWDCKMSFTALGTDPDLIKTALGAADIDDSNSSLIVPRRDLSQGDFADLWWVGDRLDGGLVAVQILNALSTGGYSLTTEKNGKGKIAVEITGHVSIDDQDTVPMKFYSISATTSE